MSPWGLGFFFVAFGLVVCNRSQPQEFLKVLGHVVVTFALLEQLEVTLCQALAAAK